MYEKYNKRCKKYRFDQSNGFSYDILMSWDKYYEV